MKERKRKNEKTKKRKTTGTYMQLQHTANSIFSFMQLQHDATTI